MEKFYTYLWLREDGTPYYVGKGCGDRAFKNYGHGVRYPGRGRTLVQEFPSEADAFAAEIFFISYYGRKDLGTGCLRNHTDGGEGCAGRRYSLETRKKMSESRIGMIFSEEHKHNLSRGGKGHHAMSEKHRRIISETHRGKLLSQEHKDVLSASLKAKWASGSRKINVVNRALTKEQVQEILKLRQSGVLLKPIAEMFGVSRPCIGNICSGKTYQS
jgi:hypothetical protein